MTNDSHEMLTTSTTSYSERLQAAVDALTRAARASGPGADWAEFVTLALAGAAANMGGIEPALSSRPGSWEAAAVRGLLVAAVGDDDELLWTHRTEPVKVTLYVSELLWDRTSAWLEYDRAQSELTRRREAAETADPPVDPSLYAWVYRPGQAGDWAPVDPEAPAWSWDQWRAQAMAQEGLTVEQIASFEERMQPSSPLSPVAYLDKSSGAGAEWRRLERERDERLARLDLEDELEQQRLREWAWYGERLKVRVQEANALEFELPVLVEVAVDIETLRPDTEWGEDPDTLERRLINRAVLETSSPADLPGTPLGRLTESPGSQ